MQVVSIVKRAEARSRKLTDILGVRLEAVLQKLRITKCEISRTCIASLAEILGVPPGRIDPNMKFSRLGLDSGMSVFLLLSLEEQLGVQLAPEEILEYPTVAKLSEHLAERYSVE